ncbi:MAG: hypothetical protein AAF726_07905 [Planctomycetota bacterium]
MNEPLKILAYTLGSAGLVVGSFVTVSLLTGTPMNEMKAVGAMFPDEIAVEIEGRGDAPAPPDVEHELLADNRSARAVLDSATTPLSAFQLADPFSSEELRGLERDLLTKLDEVDRRLLALDEREAQLEEDRRHVDDLYRRLVDLRTGILEQEAENQSVGDELEREAVVLEERRRVTFSQMASLFEDTKAKDAARLLTNVYAPAEAAEILAQLDDDRVREVIGAIQEIMPEEAGTYVRALQDLRAADRR